MPEPELFERNKPLSYLLINGAEQKNDANMNKEVPQAVKDHYLYKKDSLKPFFPFLDMIVKKQRKTREKNRKQELIGLIKKAVEKARNDVRIVRFSFDDQRKMRFKLESNKDLQQLALDIYNYALKEKSSEDIHVFEEIKDIQNTEPHKLVKIYNIAISNNSCEDKISNISKIIVTGEQVLSLKEANSEIYLNYQDIGEQVIKHANTVYTPKCNTGLQQKIKTALEDITLFDEIKHYCATNALTSILDKGLMGRKNLNSFNCEFRPAALFDGDCENGDANAICFAVNKVDDNCIIDNTTEIVLSLKKIELNNSNLFFKQKDLGYSVSEQQTFEINGQKYYFSHTKTLRNPINRHTNIQFYSANGHNNPSEYSQLLNFEFISSNMKDMHKILVMNFFKFIDNLKDIDYHCADYFAKIIYKNLDKIDPSNLRRTLIDIGKKFSNTMEFNAYASFIIPPEAIVKFVNLDTKSELYTSEIIRKLKAGENINKEMNAFPKVFDSIRYLQYLKLETQSSQISDKLSKMESPYWLKS